MKRVQIPPRGDWQRKVEEAGLIFHTENERTYWNESAYYEFESSEIDELEKATNELHQMCLSAVDHVINHKKYNLFEIPEAAIPGIEWSWEAESPTLYGRFDFVYDGSLPPKMLEYNADTPTSLLEAAVVQWKWVEEVFPERDQFNSIWEGLVEQWQWLVSQGKLERSVVHFCHCDLWEDELTVAVLRDTAHLAGLDTKSLLMDEIGWDGQSKCFVDLQLTNMKSVFKLYPWEWMVREEFGQEAIAQIEHTQWIEPAWKMLVSNKALLAVLWELFPESPYLLPSFLEGPRDLSDYVKKPMLGREGQGVEIVRSGKQTVLSPAQVPVEQRGDRVVYQQYAEVKDFDGNYPVLGSWIVGESARGIGIRETDGLITDNGARFVPHCFVASVV
jgi:glutathionylspermidine synthase